MEVAQRAPVLGRPGTAPPAPEVVPPVAGLPDGLGEGVITWQVGVPFMETSVASPDPGCSRSTPTQNQIMVWGPSSLATSARVFALEDQKGSKGVEASKVVVPGFACWPKAP